MRRETKLLRAWDCFRAYIEEKPRERFIDSLTYWRIYFTDFIEDHFLWQRKSVFIVFSIGFCLILWVVTVILLSASQSLCLELHGAGEGATMKMCGEEEKWDGGFSAIFADIFVIKIRVWRRGHSSPSKVSISQDEFEKVCLRSKNMKY